MFRYVKGAAFLGSAYLVHKLIQYGAFHRVYVRETRFPPGHFFYTRSQDGPEDNLWLPFQEYFTQSDGASGLVLMDGDGGDSFNGVYFPNAGLQDEKLLQIPYDKSRIVHLKIGSVKALRTSWTSTDIYALYVAAIRGLFIFYQYLDQIGAGGSRGPFIILTPKEDRPFLYLIYDENLSGFATKNYEKHIRN